MKSATVRTIIVLTCLVAALAVSGCASPRSHAASIQSRQGPRFSLALSPGPNYKTTTGWFLFKIPIYPQVAAWVETPDGRYLGTIYVTGKGEKGSWISAPSTGRPEALPVWNSLKQGELDSVSAATSAGETARTSDLAAGLPAGDYIVKLETNRSYDYNADYTTGSSGVCGQPSIVYRAFLAVGKGPAQASFEPIGTGSLDGADGAIHPGLEGIDTALALFSRMAVEYRE
jgi:hypothetical protein